MTDPVAVAAIGTLTLAEALLVVHEAATDPAPLAKRHAVLLDEDTGDLAWERVASFIEHVLEDHMSPQEALSALWQDVGLPEPPTDPSSP